MHILPLRNLIKAHGIQEVSGLILLISKKVLKTIGFQHFFTERMNRFLDPLNPAQALLL